jgi:hypothetical protein
MMHAGFGRVLLAVCAVASRYVDDDRVLTIDPENPDWSGPSAGWKYLAQTPFVVHTVIDRVDLVDLQYYTVCPSSNVLWNFELNHLVVDFLLDRNIVSPHWLESPWYGCSLGDRQRLAYGEGHLTKRQDDTGARIRKASFLVRSAGRGGVLTTN